MAFIGLTLAKAVKMTEFISYQESSSFFLQLFGQPKTIVLGFIPPRPAVWILKLRQIKLVISIKVYSRLFLVYFGHF
jgi:hypothetical protein